MRVNQTLRYVGFAGILFYHVDSYLSLSDMYDEDMTFGHFLTFGIF